MTFTLNYASEDDPIERFLELACLTYGRDHEDRRIEARRMLDSDPDIGRHDIFTLSCVGDFERLRTLLEAGEVDVNAAGGPMSWPPLLYACYSRISAEDCSTRESARLLLEHGANPNAYFMWGGQYKFTALTGAFGEGESGPRQQSPHPDCESLARLLLDAGANPNDSQALYNRMFTPGSRCLELLLEYGLAPTDRNNWLVDEHGKLEPNPTSTLVYQLRWAIEKHHLDRVKLILDSGIDVNLEQEAGDSFLKLAMLHGNTAAAQILIAAGATAPILSVQEQFVAACATGDSEGARKILDDNPKEADALRRLLPDMLTTAAGANRAPVVECLLQLGTDVNSLRGTTALHQAAWSGHLDMARQLIAAGADPKIKDQSHDATAADWGDYSGNKEVAEYLRGLTITE